MRLSTRGALAIAGLVLILDQALKFWVLAALRQAGGPIDLAPFFQLTLVWNRGISYGLLQQEGLGRWLLVAVTLGATVLLLVWLVRAERPLVRVALAVIVGGALGNLIDRVYYGAVVDFAHFYIGSWSWYVFNLADAAIVVGVAALLWDGFFGRAPRGSVA